MRVLALGDIHGCLRALHTLAEFVPFQADDQIVALGDYVDRGPDSRGVLDWVIERSLEDRCITLRGNHEVMMIDALTGRMKMEHWRQCGGDTTLQSYRRKGRGSVTVNDIPEEHLWFLTRELQPYHETSTHIFVHAHMLPDIPLEEQPDRTLYWERFDWQAPHQSGKIVVCGHTAQSSGVPWNKGFAVCIDTWVYGEGWLTCLDVASGQYWQANQLGETRTAQLPPPDDKVHEGEVDVESWR